MEIDDITVKDAFDLTDEKVTKIWHRLSPAEELAAEFGTDVSEWTV
jgi:hypothetical protein